MKQNILKSNFLVWFSPSFIGVVKQLVRPSWATWWRNPNILLFSVEVLLGRAWSFSRVLTRALLLCMLMRMLVRVLVRNSVKKCGRRRRRGTHEGYVASYIKRYFKRPENHLMVHFCILQW